MRVRNRQGKMRDVVCDIKDCDTQQDALKAYLEGPPWQDWVIEDGKGNGVRYETCDKHRFTRENRPTADMMRKRDG